MTTRILAVNAGSSSLKFALFDAADAAALAPALRGRIARLGTGTDIEVADGAGRILLSGRHDTPFDHSAAIAALVADLRARDLFESVAAIGHRVVHGGGRFDAPVRVTPAVREALRSIAALAPLHMPPALAGIDACATQLPGRPQVACFDTAFHSTMPETSWRLPLPDAYAERGIRRYGFHGLNYEHVVASLPALAGGAMPGRVVVFHLGAGASLCAMRDGRCVATSMGFSTLEGLMMGTRSGSIDPGVVLHLLEREHMPVAEVARLLYHEAGLLGVSGESADMRVLLASERPGAKRAIELFCARAAAEAAATLPSLQGLDAVVFTGGVGENAAEVRARIAQRLAFTGLVLDDAANRARREVLHAGGSTVRAWIVPADEERTIAQAARRLGAAAGA
ncbi:MAG: acetate/propionate family kinase [Alphaproteobacteria bacterium]|nr:acetate/propionate family kinase [Alphaproteobacteria bacterium]